MYRHSRSLGREYTVDQNAGIAEVEFNSHIVSSLVAVSILI